MHILNLKQNLRQVWLCYLPFEFIGLVKANGTLSRDITRKNIKRFQKISDKASFNLNSKIMQKMV